jgi:hypothetical protein
LVKNQRKIYFVTTLKQEPSRRTGKDINLLTRKKCSVTAAEGYFIRVNVSGKYGPTSKTN